MHSEEKILDHLLNKTFENGFYLGEQNLHLKYYQTHDQQVSKQRYLNQRATISVGQRAAKLRFIKLEDAPII